MLKKFLLFYFLIQSISIFAITHPKVSIKSDSLTPDFKLKFLVRDKTTMKPLSNVKIVVVNNLNDSRFEFFTDANGEFLKQLEDYNFNSKLNLNLTYSKKGYTDRITGYDRVLTKNGEYIIETELSSEKGLIMTPVESKNTNKEDLKEYIIIVGSFHEEIYADHTIEELKKQGYSVYSKNTGVYVRVGAYVNCSSEAELEAEKSKLKKKYPVKLWLLPENMK